MTTDDLDRRQRIARKAFARMGDLDPGALEVLAQGLNLADGPLSQLSSPLAYHADVLADDELDDDLAVLSFARVLRRLTSHPDRDDLIERLERVEGQPWQAIREALEAMAG